MMDYFLLEQSPGFLHSGEKYNQSYKQSQKVKEKTIFAEIMQHINSKMSSVFNLDLRIQWEISATVSPSFKKRKKKMELVFCYRKDVEYCCRFSLNFFIWSTSHTRVWQSKGWKQKSDEISLQTMPRFTQQRMELNCMITRCLGNQHSLLLRPSSSLFLPTACALTPRLLVSHF